MNRSKLGFQSSDEDSEDLEEQLPSKLGKKQAKPSNLLAQSLKFKQQKTEIVDEDSEVYQYDEIYDDFKSIRDKKLLGGKNSSASKGPKYMEKLLEAKNKRLHDKLVVQDLKNQRERELEGDEFKDKEVFVTGAYEEHKKSLQKSVAVEEEETVTDMKDFHRAILNNEDDDDDGHAVQTFEPQSTETKGTPTPSIITEVKNAEKSTRYSQSSRSRETAHVLKQIEQLESKTTVEQQQPLKSRLLPRLSDSEIEEARQRYFERKKLQSNV